MAPSPSVPPGLRETGRTRRRRRARGHRSRAGRWPARGCRASRWRACDKMAGPVTRWRAWRGVDRSRVSQHRDGGAWRGSASGELAAGAECQAVEGGGGVRARRQARPARRAGRRRRRRCRPASKPSPTTARSRRRTARRGSPCLWCRSRARPRECSPSAASCMPGCRSSGRALRRPSRSGRGPPETASETADGTSWWKRGRSDARDLAEAAALGLKLVRHDQPVALAIAKADRLELFQRCVDVYE